MLLRGKVCVVTGGASRRGLGLAAARLFAEDGAAVAILDGAGAEAAACGLPGEGHFGLACDVTHKPACERAAAEVLARQGQMDVLVNNAGITSPERVMEVMPGSYDRMMDVNLRGTVHMTQAVVPAMQARRAGSVVNMSSVSAQRGGGVFDGSHYAAAKAGILGYTKACARELAPHGIRCNAVCPSMIDTDITGGALTPERLAAVMAAVPMGRMGRAEEVAGCCLLLASDLSSYVTGSEIDVNGGSHIH